jgi:putative FmdB family regulatory protein
MPLYVYKCESCNKELEVKQGFNEEPLVECECGGKLYRVIFASPVHYKSPGFHVTDSRGITGKKRKPNIKVGLKGDLSPEEQERMNG